ncbi:cupin domain-containing protein [Fulvivirgaceae bacterium BMA10]|uniref:Cupin domain-containing protein n=1 Tax=Splendidivirga corallicola TaxID=3051826 RepID=A0ABT8KVV2_9BACT|nr:cupin domain-containing protein [Fulvivirgaceae bacterium BMA10]
MKLKIILMLMVPMIWACSQQQTQTEEHGHTHEGDTAGHGHSHAEGVDNSQIDTLDAQVIEATEYAPEYIQHATNIEIITNIADAVESVGVFTHEGIFGPLLFAEEMRSFFIELQPGMFLSEHPHPTESIVYTVSGKWVLCSEGKRQVMEAGSLFHFGSNMPTGWEAPFAEGAFLLIVKKKNEGEGYESYSKGLQGLAKQLDEEKAKGMQFYYNDLEPDHPAMLFAREVNPNFEEVLQNIK